MLVHTGSRAACGTTLRLQSGEKLRELEDIEEEEEGGLVSSLPLLERAKVFMHAAIQRWGFWAILAAASIPNPVRPLRHTATTTPNRLRSKRLRLTTLPRSGWCAGSCLTWLASPAATS